jgi:phosphoglycerate dehydrogenase-like enzyme
LNAVAPGRLNIVDALGDFVPEMATEWSPQWMGRFFSNAPAPNPDHDIEKLAREAHILVMALPYPKTLPTRTESLLWAHFPFAGTSNLWDSDWWGMKPMVTTSRGLSRPLPIAETAMAAAVMLAKNLDIAVEKKAEGDFSPRHYNEMKLIAGKTMGIIGLGGIGADLARLAKGWDMRVIATRRSAERREENVDGVDVLYPAADLHAMLGEADFVAVCPMLTKETEHMVNAAAFAAMKPGAILLNVARGEVIDTPALIEALWSGQVGSAYLDVWDDDVTSPPPAELLKAPNLVLTPHVSGVSDAATQRGSMDVLCENLAHLLAGEPLVNVIDWERGY